MPTTAPKVPIPLPVQGVLSGINPRLIGAQGLIRARNWIFRDGRFITRDGLLPLGKTLNDLPTAGIVNLLPERDIEDAYDEEVIDGYTGTFNDYIDEVAQPNELFPFIRIMTASGQGIWVDPITLLVIGGFGYTAYDFSRAASPGTQPDSLVSGTRDWGGTASYKVYGYIPPSIAGSFWTTVSHDRGPDAEVLDDGFLTDGKFSMSVVAAGNPSFLGAEGDGYLLLTLSDDEASRFVSPIVEIPILGGEYECRIKLATMGGGTETVKIYPVTCKYSGTTENFAQPPESLPEEDPVSLGLTYNWSDLEFHTGSEVELEVDGDADQELVATVDLSTFPDHTHIGFIVECQNDGNSYLAFAQAQITFDSDNVYRAPSTPPTLYGDVSSVATYERPMGLIQYDFDQTQIFTVMGTDKSWQKLNSVLTWTSLADLTDDPLHDDYDAEAADGNLSPPLTAAEKSSQVDFRVFDSDGGKVLLGVNSEDPMMFWDGVSANYKQVVASAASPVTGQKIKAKTMAITFNRVMLGNIVIDPEGATPTAYPDGIITTEALFYDNWGGGVTNVVRLADTPGPITAIQEMGNQITAIYKTDAIYTSQASGGAIPFSYQLKAAHITGPASPLAVVPIDEGLHVYLAQDGDLVVFDGVRPRSLTQTSHNYLQNSLDFKHIDQAFGVYNRALKELYFIYPPYPEEDASAGVMVSLQDPQNPTLWPLKWRFPITAAGFSYVNQSKLFSEFFERWSDVDATWNSFTSFTPNTLFGSAAQADYQPDGVPEGVVYTQRGGTDWRGNIKSFLETGLNDFGELSRYKTVHEIDHLFVAKGGGEADVYLKAANFGSDDGVVDIDTVALDEGPFISSHRISARLFSLGFETDTPAQLEWLGSEAAISMRGSR